MSLGHLFDQAAPGAQYSMKAASILDDGDRASRLKALVDAAESELGQAVLRDLQLSFELPRSVVGMRRTALLGRRPTWSSRPSTRPCSTRRTPRCARLGVGVRAQ